MIKSRFNINNPLLHLFTIILVTFVFYSSSLNNFFYADDLIWLDRIKHLPGNWAKLFTIENRYFTPLTYISFYLNQKLFDLNPYWYHLHDVVIHSMNGLLLYFLTWRISRNRLTSFVAAILFVSASSILITVLWPSARTDLIMVFFSLATLITFTGTDSTRQRIVPVVLYLLALGAKGTAIVIPAALFFLTSRDKPLRRRALELLPYLTINAVYMLLLVIINVASPNKHISAQNLLSFSNFAMSLPTLIIPQSYLTGTSMPLLLVLSVIILLVLIGIAVRFRETSISVGVVLTVFGILPLIFTRNYVLAGNQAIARQLLSSPSNRVYLACAGISVVYAVLFEKLLRNKRMMPVRVLAGILLASLLCFNFMEIRSCNKNWAIGTKHVRKDLLALTSNRAMLTEDSVLLLYNFEASSGFSRAMINTFIGLENYEVHTFDSQYINVLTDLEKSPLNNAQYDYNSSKVKMIMDCPANQYVDKLISIGNQTMQTVMADYRQLYAAGTPAEELLIRTRQEENLLRLKRVLYDCMYPPR